MKKITQEIVGLEPTRSTKDAPPEPSRALEARPDVLSGKTYKLKPPTCDHAVYVTINDKDGLTFEIFLQTKDPKHMQWMAALTRVLSAVFRRSEEIDWLIEELTMVYDPAGGFFDGPKYVPSLVAAIGETLKRHIADRDGSFRGVDAVKETGIECPKCLSKTLIKQAGCEECTSCGYNKCS